MYIGGYTYEMLLSIAVMLPSFSRSSSILDALYLSSFIAKLDRTDIVSKAWTNHTALLSHQILLHDNDIASDPEMVMYF